MGKYTDEELYHTLSETGRLLQGVEDAAGEEYSLESILAEFGQGAAEPAQKPEEPAVSETIEEPAASEKPEETVQAAEEEIPAAEEPVQPVQNETAQEEVTVSPAPVREMIHTADLRKTIASAVEQVLTEESVSETEDDEDTKDMARLRRESDTQDAPEKELTESREEQTEEPKEELPEEPEEESAEEPTVLQTGDGEEKDRDTPEESGEEPAAPEQENDEQTRPDQPAGYPGDPEGADQRLSLEQVMSQTVEAVLEEDDSILEPRVSLKRRFGKALAAAASKLARSEKKHAPRKETEDTGLWEAPQEEPEKIEAEPEPDMEQAAKQIKRLCKKWHRSALYMAIPTVLLVALSVLDGLKVLPELWQGDVLLRFGTMGGLLLIAMLLAAPVWRRMTEELQRRHVGCELAAGLSAAVSLADCIYGAATGKGENLPFAAPAAVMLWLCLYGMVKQADARREAYHLADLGGEPPYAVTVTAAGACKQKGKLEGFYHLSERDDPSRRWQLLLLPLLMAAATVLTGVVCLGDQKMDRVLWIWSAMLTASLPFSLPLSGALPMHWLNHRLVKSGSAAAGYYGARMVSRSKRMVLTDDDVFPPGTVGLNGLKIYGEEIGKVVSYAATVTKAAGSQLSPLFEQLLASEGGFHMELQDLHFYEEGGVGGTIEGESVTMGSAYFMRKKKVTLPRELKLKTGVFLAVDGQLIAIFAIKYQPSRNVEWALQAIRRSRIQPVLAARSGNITPGLLHRKFNLDVKPVYPDVSTRLALSDLSDEMVEKPGAIIYREGLMPFAETVIGSRRLVSAVRISTVLCYIGALAGLVLSYYLTHVGIYDALSSLRMLVFLLLWLVPTLLLSGMVKHF